MPPDAFFTENTPPGGVVSREELRLLLLFLSGATALPLTFEAAVQAVIGEGIANWFEFTGTLRSLIGEGKIEAAGCGGGIQLTVSPAMKDVCLRESVHLPERIRSKALFAAERYLEQEMQDADRYFTMLPLPDGGFYVTLRQGEGADMLMRITLYCADYDQTVRLREKFLADPEALFGQVLNYLDS
ncbi:MAG: DUF4364 family protein [Oscillospiraceae bacterium]|nr:DUF4364 family protein [Oscillospiraceae bacterium]